MVAAATITADDEPIVPQRGDPRPHRPPSRSLFPLGQKRVGELIRWRVESLIRSAGDEMTRCGQIHELFVSLRAGALTEKPPASGPRFNCIYV